MEVPPYGWFIRENPIKMIKMDDLGVPGYPYFRKPPYMPLSEDVDHVGVLR